MTLRRTLLASFLFLTASAQIACAGGAPPPAVSAKAAFDATPSPSPPPAPAAAAGAAAPVAVAPSTPGVPAPAKGKVAGKERAPSLIFTGELKMLADEDAIPKTIDHIIDLAEAAGGHVAARKDASVQIKVPSTVFRQTMKEIDGIGGVTSQSISAEDVSEELHDLDVRLANLRATRARLQELLGRAGGIPDVLTVEKELERVAQEIDRTEGRLEFLKTRASLSLITVNLTAKPKPAVAVVAPPSVKPPPKVLSVPIPWVGEVGIDPLLSLSK